jgi:hypothetical protein
MIACSETQYLQIQHMYVEFVIAIVLSVPCSDVAAVATTGDACG